jgi:elongation factor 3
MPSVEAMDAKKATGAKVASENAKSIKVLDELMSKLSVSKSQDETNAAARNIASFINGDIEEADAPTKYVLALVLNHYERRGICGKR